MLRIEVYPVLDGIEVGLAAVCMDSSHVHTGVSATRVWTFVSPEDIDRRGAGDAVAAALGQMFYEWNELLPLARC